MTIREVAQAAGVSKATVSRYLNGDFDKMSVETRKKIAAVIKQLDYHPSKLAQSLKTKKSGLLGFVVADMGNLYSAKLISGASKFVRHRGYQLLIMDSDNDPKLEQEAIQKLESQSVEGIVLQPMSKKSATYANINCPVVLTDRTASPTVNSSVVTNNYDSAYKIGEEIVAKRYQRILMVSEPVGISQVRTNRLEGIQSVVAEHDLQFELMESADFESADWQTAIQTRLKEIASDDVKTAVFANNSKALVSVLKSIQQLKLQIPKQLGLCGFDDWSWTSIVQPAITSIAQDSEQVGEKSIELLLKIIHGKKHPAPIESIVVPSFLNIRDSL